MGKTLKVSVQSETRLGRWNFGRWRTALATAKTFRVYWVSSYDPSLLGLDRQIQTWNGYGKRRLHAIPLERSWIY
jgi:hypothetical protein